MPVNRLKPFTAALAGISLLATGMAPVASHAESLQDVFTQQELDILFGEGAQIPKYIGPHRLVMSLEEARQIEGEAAPIVPLILIGFGFGAAEAAWRGENVLIGGAQMGATVGGGILGGMGARALGAGLRGQGIAAAVGGGAVGFQMTAINQAQAADCPMCHQAK